MATTRFPNVKGFFPTPLAVVDLMVDKLFHRHPPEAHCRVLDTGCGEGVFIDGVIRWCHQRGAALPTIVGIEADPRHAHFSRTRFASIPEVEIREADFLAPTNEKYDYVIGNPPYVSILGIDEEERTRYRLRYRTARGRFDLYMLFFEEALSQLKPAGRMVYITPEKFVYVETAAALRGLLAGPCVEELHFVPENTFGELVTYPLISTISNARSGPTKVVFRDGSRREIVLLPDSRSWLTVLAGDGTSLTSKTLEDICLRISCGVATGADSVFTMPAEAVSDALRPFAYPTVSGRQLRPEEEVVATNVLLLPYNSRGELLPEEHLGALGEYLREPSREKRLRQRTCTLRKPWFAYHESPPLRDLLQPKILCKDIGRDPFFLADRAGTIVPRHSVYYLIPKDPAQLEPLLAFLNSPTAQTWLRRNCQRAANGFFRLQSHVLKRLPIPDALAIAGGGTAANASGTSQRSA